MFRLLLDIRKPIPDHEASMYWVMIQHSIWILMNLLNCIHKKSGTHQPTIRTNVLPSVCSRKGDSSVNQSVVCQAAIITLCTRKTLCRIKDTRSLSHFKANIVDLNELTNTVKNHSKNHTSSFAAGTETLIDLEATVSDFSLYHCVPLNIDNLHNT
jgi:hypothetical protein